MPKTGFLPDTDLRLLDWSVQFKDGLQAHTAVYGISSTQLSAYVAAHNAFATALATATNPATRTKGTVAAKNDARSILKVLAGSYGRMIGANTLVTSQQKLDIGLKPRAIPRPVPPPTVRPGFDIVGVDGRTVKVILYTAGSPTRRGRPKGVTGASVFSFVGQEPPSDPSLYKFEGSTSKREFEVTFPLSVEPGAKVYLAAFWYSATGMSGPASTPQEAYIQYGPNASSSHMKMAA